MEMTASEYETVVGRVPEGDELERANCPKEGTPGHRCCGLWPGSRVPRTMPQPPAPEPCGWCGATQGFHTSYDGWPRCNACDGC